MIPELGFYPKVLHSNLFGIVFGIWLGNPFVNIFEQSKFFYGLKNVTTLFSLFAFAWGLSGNYALIHRIQLLKKVSAFLGFLFWGYIAFYTFLYDPFYVSFPLMTLLSIKCAWLFFRTNTHNHHPGATK